MKFNLNTQFSKPTNFLLLLFFIFFACSTEDDDEQMRLAQIEEANETLAQLQEFVQSQELQTPELLEETKMRDEADQAKECVVEMYKAAPGYDEMLALDPTTDVIYPGAMLKGESIPTGEYIAINGGRAPITLSVSLENINGSPSVEIEDPRLSTVREGVKDLLSQGVNGSTAARTQFETQQVYSEEHLNIALGANYRSAGKSVSAAFDFSSSEYQYKYVIKYLQIYYTIDLDLPDNEKPGTLFNEVPNLNSTSPVIVSSVKYGRMVLYTVESNYSRTEIESSFNASFATSDGSIDADYEKVINQSSIKALVIGGSGKDAAKVVEGPQGVYEYITNGGNFSSDSPAAPLAYTLRYIKKDFPIARLVLTSEYPIRTCYEAWQKFRIEIYGFNCVDNDNEIGRVEIFGNMQAKLFKFVEGADDKLESEVKWDRKKAKALGVDENKFFKISDKWAEVELYKPDLDKDYVELTAQFWERDLRNDDYFGQKTEKILLKDLNTTRTDRNYVRINLDEDYGSDMRAYFYAYRVDY